MIDFANALLTAVSFPKWTGGKFLVNCLSLSPDAVMQDRDLAHWQLTQGLTAAQKLDVLLKRLSQVGDQWNDLDLGGPSFFGFGQDCWLHCDLDNIQYWPFDPIVARTIEAGKRFFFIGHHVLFMQRFAALWPNLSVIVLHNAERFCSQYRPQYLARRHFEKSQLDQLWQAVPALNDTALPQDLAQWNNLAESLKEQIYSHHTNIWLTWQRWQYEKNVNQNQLSIHQRLIGDDRIQGWDLDWYLDKELFLTNMESCYDWLNLRGFDRDMIFCYHTAWLDKLQQMKWQAFATEQPSDRWRVQPYRPSI